MPAPVRDHTSRLLLRSYERYLGYRAADQKHSEPDGGFPLPPARLRVTVVGYGDPDKFLRTGAHDNQLIRETLTRNGIQPEKLETILDWGCGCGRLTRWWDDLTVTQVSACDYNSQLTDWVTANLPFVTALTNDLEPPLPYADDSFDLVYALSVFTHLTDELAIRWMNEVSRILRPGGVFFFTSHGRAHEDRLNVDELRAFRAGHSVIQFEAVQGTNLCAAYQPRSWVETTLTDGLVVLDAVEAHDIPPAEWHDIAQDRYLVQKPPA